MTKERRGLCIRKEEAMAKLTKKVRLLGVVAIVIIIAIIALSQIFGGGNWPTSYAPDGARKTHHYR